MADKYDERGREIANYVFGDGVLSEEADYFAKALRECAAEAFEEAAKAVETEGECYCSEHLENPEGLCLIMARAAALRSAGGERPLDQGRGE